MAFKEDFQKKIFEIAFDRLIVGAIVGVVVYFATIQIEKNKADEAFNMAINQMRVQKIAEIWEEAAKLEEKYYDLYHVVEGEKIQIGIIEGKRVSKEMLFDRDRVAIATKEFETAWENFYKKFWLYRFYLGESLEKHITEYYLSLHRLKIIHEMTLEKGQHQSEATQILEESMNKLDSFRANIDQIKEYLIRVN